MSQLSRVFFRCLALTIGLVIGLGGCSPMIEGWRDINGLTKNDPGPDAPFIQNLAEAEAKPYPNLASVPPPPTRETTAAERQKLTQRLLADRAAAEAAGHKLTASAGVTTPSPPSALTTTSVGAAGSGAAMKTANAEPRAAGRQPARRQATETPPPNSNLQQPEINSLPEPETARPAPPPPTLPAATRPPPAVAPTPAALASAKPEAPPPVPNLPPPPPPVTGKSSVKRVPGLVTVATLAGAAADGHEQSEIAELAARYKQEPGRVRVVGYAAAPAAGADPLASYQAALDRAQAVAKALTAAGVPASKIQTEATPAAATAGVGHIDVQFGP